MVLKNYTRPGTIGKEDPVLRWIGDFGRWQARTSATIVILMGFFTSWQILTSSFILPSRLDYVCTNVADVVNHPPAITMPSSNNKTVKDQCNIKEDGTGDVIKCDAWNYKTWNFTLVSEFNLVCDRRILISHLKSINQFGIMVGVAVSGYLSDRFGRKLIMLIMSCGILISGIISSFSTSIEMFFVFYFLIGAFVMGAYNCGYVYCLEMVGGKWSTYVGISIKAFWAVGMMSLALFTWLVPNWRNIQLWINLPVLLFIISLIIPGFMPESPRWLMFHGKREEAEEILKGAAKVNGRIVKDDNIGEEYAENNPEKNKTGTIMDLFRNWSLLSRSLIMYYIWFTCSLVYYGLLLNAGSIIPNVGIHINFIAFGALEIVSNIVTTYCLLYLGRRWSLSLSFFLAATSLLSLAVLKGSINESYSLAKAQAVLAHLGKFAITCAFAIIYVYTAEMFPTVVRNAGMGTSSVCARVGSIISPYMSTDLGRVTSPVVPIVIFGMTTLGAGLLTLILPETKNKVLPNTIEEAERFYMEQRGELGCGKKKNLIIEKNHQNLNIDSTHV